MYNVLPTLLALCLFSQSLAQKSPDYRNEALLLTKNLSLKHFSPRNIDDQFSNQVFNQCLRNLDPNKLIFAEADIQSLSKYKSLLDDELQGKSWNFLNDLTKLYISSVQRTEACIQFATENAFTENSKEYYIHDTARWAINEIELKARWRLRLKYKSFDKLTDLKKDQKNNIPDFFNKYEAKARLSAKSSALRPFKQIQSHATGIASYVASIYFKSITAVYDPHTSYMSTTEMENFLTALSTEGYYFGITLGENNNGDVLIATVTPGGPAWKSGEINTSDIILNLTWEGQKQQDIGISLEEANDMLEDANHTTMEFTLKSTDGLVKKVKLKKEKISMEENYAHGYVLNGGYKIGYISLPDFYTQWGHELDGSKCATDVAEEIIKLKKEKINGLILDLRNNGGGALKEAIAMAGIFIDEGPLGITKDKAQVATLLKDINRGTIYDGPLIVLVNSRSASASEFLAAVLQDYNRALIVGSTTYGKATAQTLSTLTPGQGEPSLASTKTGLGFASITTNKIYRVTGASAQGRGVKPDIVLPDIYDVVVDRESELPYVLAGDSSKKRTYYKPLLPLPHVKLRKQSELRVKSSLSFQGVNQSRAYLSEFTNKREPVTLQWQQFSKQREEQSLKYIALAETFRQPNIFYEVANSTVDKQRMNVDEYADAFSKLWMARLAKDIYVTESFLILTDLLEMNCH